MNQVKRQRWLIFWLFYVKSIGRWEPFNGRQLQTNFPAHILDFI